MENRAYKVLLSVIVGIAMWRSIDESAKEWVLLFLGSLTEAAERERQEKERQQQLDTLHEAAGNITKNHERSHIVGVSAEPALPLTGSSVIENIVSMDFSQHIEKDARLREVIVHPAVVLILGKRGSGKSALGYRLLELFRYALCPYEVGVPSSARSILPEWIGIVPTLEDLPPKAIGLVDEAYLPYHARSSMAAEARSMSQVLNLSRQRNQTLIFVTQEARQVDLNIASSASVIVFKDLGVLQLEFDRKELNKLASQAREDFARIGDNRRRWSFVYAPDSDFVGMQENLLPSFWKPRLSHLFAEGQPSSVQRAPRRLSSQARVQKAKELRLQGASYREIAVALGVSRGTVVNYLKGYPYRS